MRNFSNRLTSRRLAQAGRFCSSIIVSTSETRHAFAQAGLPTHRLPEAGIHRHPEPRQRSSSARLRLMFAGRIIFYKGVHLALHALKVAGGDAELVVFGNGSLQPAMERLAQRLGLGSQVNFRGWIERENLLQTYPEFDAFLFPSLHDGFPQSLLEAMASGMPAICLDCGGPGQVVAPGCGVKVSVGRFDQMVRGLADAIAHYSTHRDAVAEQGFNAWKHVMKEYLWESLGQRLDAIYRDVLDRRAATDSRQTTRHHAAVRTK